MISQTVTLNGHFGLIIPLSSGVLYTAQTGGYACHQREAEGVFVPLMLDRDSESSITGINFGWAHLAGGVRSKPANGIDAEAARVLDAVLAQNTDTRHIAVDRLRLADSEEAWVYVLIFPFDRPFDVWTDACGVPAILTWTNSD